MIRQQHPGARVIIVTDYDDPDLRAEARALGAAAYVLKEDLKRLQQIIKAEADDG
jgi:DNA-binding NarL/FixJ family response regulator